MGRNYAALPHEYLEECADLSDAEFGRLIRALLEYSKTGREVTLSGGEKYLWRRVRGQEDRYQESYESTSDKRKAAANKRWKNDANECKTMQNDANECKTPQTETETETETNTETDTNIQLASASRDNNAPAPAREAGSLTRRVYGTYVRLDISEFGKLLQTLGHTEMSRRIKLVDLPENEGKDFFKLIMSMGD